MMASTSQPSHPNTHVHYDPSRFAEQLTPDRLATLASRGWVAIDGFFGSPWSSALLDELRAVRSRGDLVRNRTQFGLPDGRVLVTQKPHIYEADLHDGGVRAKLPELGALFRGDDLVDALNAARPALRLTRGVNGKTIKLQYNAGSGACFPVHYDNPGKPNKRKLTLLVYLNEGWRDGDGGELQLLPFMDAPVVLAPSMDRLVVFESERILHRVLPARKERFCFTVWLDGEDTNRKVGVRFEGIPPLLSLSLSLSLSHAHTYTFTRIHTHSHIRTPTLPFGFFWQEDGYVRVAPGAAIEDIAAGLASGPSQRIVSRALYREEYEASLRECMQGAEGEDAMVALHRAHLAAVAKHDQLSRLVQRLRDLKQARGREQEGEGAGASK